MLLGIILIVLCLIIIAAVAVYFLKSAEEPDAVIELSPEILEQYNIFKEQVKALNSSCNALDNLVSEYFISLTSSGYSDLNNLRTNLNIVLQTASELSENNNQEELKELLEYVLSDNSEQQKVPDSIFRQIGSDNISNWQQRSEELLNRIDSAISGVSSNFKQVGRSKSSKKRERQATDSVLGEVRKAMIAVAKKNPM